MKTKVVTIVARANCDCPLWCRFCGAHRLLGRDGHYCPTGKCVQHDGYLGCKLKKEDKREQDR